LNGFEYFSLHDCPRSVCGLKGNLHFCSARALEVSELLGSELLFAKITNVIGRPRASMMSADWSQVAKAGGACPLHYRYNAQCRSVKPRRVRGRAVSTQGVGSQFPQPRRVD
jgi:hypothetical protein